MELVEKLRIEEAITIKSDKGLKIHYEAVLNELLSDLEIPSIYFPHEETLMMLHMIESEIIRRWTQSIK